MTTLHPFSTSRESILPIWSSTAQSRRSQPDATVTELFVLLHGMLFTNIQLDDFAPTLSRFLERLEIEGAEEREWIMMAVTNIGAIMEYGRPGGVLRRAGGAGARDAASTAPFRVFAKRNVPAQPEEDTEEKRMDVDDEKSSPLQPHASPMLSDTPASLELSQAFKYAMQLAFSMLSVVLRNSTRKASPFAESTLNPYLTVLLTFLTTVSKQPETLAILERFIPWEDLATFFTSIPKHIHVSQGLHVPAPTGTERWVMLTSSCAPPLPEDWCMRGMEWVGRKVFERGYWKSAEDRRVEIEVLDIEEGDQLTDGIIQDEDADERGSELKNETAQRWTRITRTAVNLAGLVDGFTWVEGTRDWKVDGVLEAKVSSWRDEDRHDREEEDVRRRGRRWTDDTMDVDDAEVNESSEGEDDDDDSEEVKALKVTNSLTRRRRWLTCLQARRRYLRSLLASAQRLPPASSTLRSKRHPRRPTASTPMLNVVPGYSVLVLDTNILLSSLSVVASIIESLRWTVVIPVPVIMELDGLGSNISQLGEAAQEAVAYITSHVRSHAMSLKVQTSKGNYLTSLNVRTEQVEFSDEASWDRCMDDLILKAAIWQDEHWIDRSVLLKAGGAVRDTKGAVKVVLLSLDRNRESSCLVFFMR
jgi:protein SMG6